MNDIFFNILRAAIGTKSSLSRIPTDSEWNKIYKLSENQSLVGICFAGLQNLGANADTGFREIGMSEAFFFNWMGNALSIMQRNDVLNCQCVELLNKLSAEGLPSAIIKGQGVARLYDPNLIQLRQCGDIDVWVKGGFEKVNEFVQSTAPSKDIAYHRFHYDIFMDTEVELHFRPALMRNLLDNRKLQKWCDSFDEKTFEKEDSIDIIVPPLEFNAVYILTHIYRHFLFEGVGMRHVLDYYYVLKALPPKFHPSVLATLKDFRMAKFAAAIMWVMGYVFGMDEKYMICKPDSREGRFLLEEIMKMGNFGKSDLRYKGNSKTKRFAKHWAHLLLHYPSEVVWSPIWIVYHWFWKRNKIRMIDRKLQYDN